MDKQAVLNALVALGSTREQIAANLEKHGIKGKKRSCYTCPVAKYLQTIFLGKVVEVDTKDYGMAFWCFSEASGHLFFDKRVHSEVNGVIDFITSFDSGEFCHLCG